MTRVTQYIMSADKGDMASTPAEQFGRRVREGSTDLSLDVQGAQARLRMNRMVPLDIATQIMELLTAGAKH